MSDPGTGRIRAFVDAHGYLRIAALLALAPALLAYALVSQLQTVTGTVLYYVGFLFLIVLVLVFVDEIAGNESGAER